MKKDNIVNIKSTEKGYWKGKITNISDKWEYILKSGEVLSYTYSHPIATICGLNGISHAVLMEEDLIYKNGEYWEV